MIPEKCSKDNIQMYKNAVMLPRPKHMYPTERTDWITVDFCMVPEILCLWQQGIWTTGCCCGHGIDEADICVIEEHKQKMIDLGYKSREGKDWIFLAKTNNHVEFK